MMSLIERSTDRSPEANNSRHSERSEESGIKTSMFNPPDSSHSQARTQNDDLLSTFANRKTEVNITRHSDEAFAEEESGYISLKVYSPDSSIATLIQPACRQTGMTFHRNQ